MKVGFMNNKKVIFGLIMVAFIFIGAIYCLLPLPQSDTDTLNCPSEFYITTNNQFELQPPGQCAAYSSAFVVRHFGHEAESDMVYKHMRFKIPVSGYVLPKGMIIYIQESDLKPEIYRGNLLNLKSRLTKSNPVIVLIGQGLQWQHYMTLLGYNATEKELYFYDSKKSSDENGALPGNRTLTEDYFLTLWDNGLPIFNHVYITVSA